MGGKDPLLHPPPRRLLQPGRPQYPGAEALPEMPAFLETKALLREGGQGEAGLESCCPDEGVGPLPWGPCQLRTPAGWQVGPSMPGPAFGAATGRAGTSGGARGCSEWPAVESPVDPWPSPGESPAHPAHRLRARRHVEGAADTPEGTVSLAEALGHRSTCKWQPGGQGPGQAALAPHSHSRRETWACPLPWYPSQPCLGLQGREALSWDQWGRGTGRLP